MFRRLTLATVFLVFGFVAGMVLTGRMRTAEEAVAQSASQAGGASEPHRRLDRGRDAGF